MALCLVSGRAVSMSIWRATMFCISQLYVCSAACEGTSVQSSTLLYCDPKSEACSFILTLVQEAGLSARYMLPSATMSIFPSAYMTTELRKIRLWSLGYTPKNGILAEVVFVLQ